MNIYCIKCSKLTNNNALKVKNETGEENYLYSDCIDCNILYSYCIVLL